MKENKGLSLIELLVTMAVIGAVVGISALNLKPLNNDAQNAAGQVVGFLKLARAKAMSTTSAYRISYDANRQPVLLYAERAKRCSDSTWTPDPKLQTELPAGVALTIDFRHFNFRPVCFDSRGFTAAYIRVRLQDDRARTREVEVLVGGTARVLP